MQRCAVIPVDAVLDHQLPVRVAGVLVRSREYPHPIAGLIGDQVDVLLRTGEKVRERLGVVVEADEPEVAVALESWDMPQPERGRVDGLGISLSVGDAD